MKRGSIREVALFAMLGAMIFAAKMAMAQFPNIEPVSLLVMLLAVCFGWKGLYAVYLYVLLEFAMWGIGLWSVCYLYVWLILFVLARLLRRKARASARQVPVLVQGQPGCFSGSSPERTRMPSNVRALPYSWR